jgi:hypothetical protein
MKDLAHVYPELDMDGLVQPLFMDEAVANRFGGFFTQDGTAGIARDHASHYKRNQENA